MPALLALVASLGGIAFWRRKKIKTDAQRISSAARETVNGMRSGRKGILVELGQLTYAKSTGAAEPDSDAEMSRLVDELEQMDAADEDTDADAGQETKPTVDADAAG